MTKEQQLASDVERALARYHGEESFRADEWPELAQAFANVVVTTHLSAHNSDDLEESVKAGTALAAALAGFVQAAAGVID